jgi:hypothetical protein
VKKLATILLLALLLFNFVGYKLVFNALQQKAGKDLVSRIDHNAYNEADLITITVPLSMPYLNDSKDFERKDGEITFNGKIYHYVKEKVSQGNLVLMCLPDEQKMRIQSAKDDFSKLANELQNNTSSKKSGDNSQVLKLTISDYEQLQTASFDFYPIQTTDPCFTSASYALQIGEGVTPEQPPEA